MYHIYRIYIVFFVFLLTGFAICGHPLISDDSGTLGRGGVQLELTPELINTKFIQATHIPIVLTYGLADNLDIITGTSYLHFSRAGAPGNASAGLSDFEIAFKWRFLNLQNTTVALRPVITLPVGDYQQGRGSGKTTLGAALIASSEFSSVITHINAAYTRNENRNFESLNLWHFSVAAEYNLDERFTAVANFAADKNVEKAAEGDPVSGIIGMVFTVNESTALDFGIKFGLNKYEDQSTFLSGITLQM